jgi:hypothetical protein
MNDETKLFFAEGRVVRSQISLSLNERADSMACGWLFGKGNVLDGRSIAPKIGAVEIAERQPDTRMHRGVVVRITLLWRMIASHLQAARSFDVGKVGAEDLIIAKDISCHRLLVHRDHELILAFAKADARRLGGDCRSGRNPNNGSE